MIFSTPMGITAIVLAVASNWSTKNAMSLFHGLLCFRFFRLGTSRKKAGQSPAIFFVSRRPDPDNIQLFMIEWNIQSRAHACERCAQPFADKQPIHTLLVDERSVLRRTDICEDCWQKEAAAVTRDRKGFVSQWQGVYETPPAHPVEAIQKESAETLLRKLAGQNDPKHGPAAFILAIMLERKRLLKVKEQIKRDGQRIIVYEQPKTGDIFTVTDPDLRLDQLEAVQRDVAQLLEHGLNPPPAATEAAVAVATGSAPAEPVPETIPQPAEPSAVK